MYERFTDKARKVMQQANQEAQHSNHEWVSTEHILLGLVKEGSGVAANVLTNLGIDLRKIRPEFEKIIQCGQEGTTRGKLPPTPRARKVIEYALQEARNLKHSYVGTEHLLLGLLRDQEGDAAQVLKSLGLKLEDVRAEVLDLLGHPIVPGIPPAPAGKVRAPGWACPDDQQRTQIDHLPVEARQAVRDLEDRIDRLTLEKEEAVAEQDFEKAVHLRDQADKLKTEREALLRAWLDRPSS